MANIPRQLEWDPEAKKWGPLSDAPDRITANWDTFNRKWVVKHPDDLSSGYLSMLPNAVERGVRSDQESTNLIGAETGLESPEAAGRRIAELERRKQAIAPSPEVQQDIQDLYNQDGVLDTLGFAATHPRAVGNIVGEGLGSLGSTLLGAAGIGVGAGAAAAATTGPLAPVTAPVAAVAATIGQMVWGGAKGGTQVYTQKILDGLAKQGVDITDAKSLTDALNDPELMGGIREDAVKSGLSAGAIQAVSFGIAGKLKTALGAADKGASLTTRLKGAAAEVGAQAGLGATGAGLENGFDDTAGMTIGALQGGIAAPFEAFAAMRGRSKLRGAPEPTVEPTAEEPAPQIPNYHVTNYEDAVDYLKTTGKWKTELENASEPQIVAYANRAIERDVNGAEQPLQEGEAPSPQRSDQDLGNLRFGEQVTVTPEGQAQRTGQFPEMPNEEQRAELSARENLEKTKAGSQFALPEQEIQTPWGRMRASQVDQFLASNAEVPGVLDIIHSNLPLDEVRKQGLELLARREAPPPAFSKEPGVEPSRAQEQTQVSFPDGTVTTHEQAFDERARQRERGERPDQQPLLPDDFGPEPQPQQEELPALPPDFGRELPQELNGVVTQEQYNGIATALSGLPKGQPVSMQVLKLAGNLKNLKEAKAVADYLTRIGKLRDGGKGKPPLNFTSGAAEAAPEQHPVFSAVEDRTGGQLVGVTKDGNFGLVRALNKLGSGFLYLPVSKEKNVFGLRDVENLPQTGHDWLTPGAHKELVEFKLRDIADRIAARDEKGEGIYGEKPGVTTTKSVPDSARGFVHGLLNLVGLKKNKVVIVSYSDIQDKGFVSQFAKKDLEHAVGIKMFQANDDRVKAFIHNGGEGRYIIAVRDDVLNKPRLLMYSLGHEVGHLIKWEAFDNAAKDTKEAIIKAFSDTIDKMVAEGPTEGLKRFLNPHNYHNFLQGNRAKNFNEFSPQTNYWLGKFDEWFAEQVSRWATSDAKPLTLVDKFFRGIADRIRKVAAMITGSKFVTDKTVADFLNNMNAEHGTFSSGDGRFAQAADTDAARIRDFEGVANAQRGAPESAMVRAQHTMGGGVKSYLLEHVGDLTHRATEMVRYGNYGLSNFGPKVERALYMLKSGYGFEREHNENMASNARVLGRSLDEHMKQVNAAEERYAQAHEKVPVYNELQENSRNAAIHLARGHYGMAAKYLENLKGIIDSGKYQDEAAKYDPNFPRKEYSWQTDPLNPYRTPDAATTINGAKAAVEHPIDTAVARDSTAAEATKDILPSASAVYKQRAEKTQETAQDFDRMGRPPSAPKSKLQFVKAPREGDHITFMNWWNRHVNTLDYAMYKFPLLKPYGMAIKQAAEIAKSLRRDAHDTIREVFFLKAKEDKILTDFMELHDSLGENAKFTENKDGSITLNFNPDDLKGPLRAGNAAKKGGSLTLPKEITPVWRDVRKMFDNFLKDIKKSMLAKFGFDPELTVAQLDKMIAEEKSPQAQRRLNGLKAYLEDFGPGYQKGYLPHIRSTSQHAMRLTITDPEGNVHVRHVDSPWGRRSSAQRAMKMRDQLEAQGWKDGTVTMANDAAIIHQLRGRPASVDTVSELIGMLHNSEDAILQDGKGNPLHNDDGSFRTRADEILELLGDVKQKLLAERAMKGRLAKRKHVPGYIHEGNEAGYLRAVLADYIGSGSQMIGNNYTSMTRLKAMADLGPHRDLFSYALEHDREIRTPTYGSATLRALGFHFALGFNLSSAMINSLQTFQTTFPFLAAMGGVTNSGRHVLKAFKDAGLMVKLGADPDAVFRLDKKPSFLTQDEFDLLRTARRLGVTEPIMSAELAGGQETLHTLNGIERNLGHALRRVGAVSSLMFSATEQANRITAVLAAYRMFKSDPSAVAKAKKFAAERTWRGKAPESIEELAMMIAEETQFNMSKENRPRFLQGWEGVPFQFSQYPVMMMELMARAAGMGGRGFLRSKEGNLLLGLMVAGVWTTAGLMGLPMVRPVTSSITAASNVLAPLMGLSPVDTEQEIRKGIVALLQELGSSDPVNSVNWIMKGGFRQITGVSTEGRTALDWPRMDMLSGNAFDFLGPVGSIAIGGMGDAMNHLKNGNTGLAIATMMPNLAARNLAKGIYANPPSFAADALGIPEKGIGIPSKMTGTTLIKPGDISNKEGFLMSLGFTPSRIADTNEAVRSERYQPMQEARKDLANEIAQYQMRMVLAQKEGNDKLAAEMANRIRMRINGVVAHDGKQKDPRLKYVLDWASFNQGVNERVLKNLQGAFGPAALKNIPARERWAVIQDLKNTYGMDYGK